MMSAGPHLLRNLGGEPSRVIYLYAGTDPSAASKVFNIPFYGKIGLNANPIDCFMGGSGTLCLPEEFNYWMGVALEEVRTGDFDPALKEGCKILEEAGLDEIGGGGPTDYPPPLNDQAVPIASAMACNVDMWSNDAKMALTNNGTLYFPHGLCKNNEKIWLAAARNDTVFAAQHGQMPKGVEKRAAYATPGSFWTHRQRIRAFRARRAASSLTRSAGRPPRISGAGLWAASRSASPSITWG
jgi:hypothetical protein